MKASYPFACHNRDENFANFVFKSQGSILGRSLQFVEEVAWDFSDWEKVGSADDDNTVGNFALKRLRHRRDFAQAILQNPLLACKSAEMRFERTVPEDEMIRGLSVVPPEFSYDPFSAALRTFSQNLTSLNITSACLSAEIFWPSPNENQEVMPT